jgi:predicted nucleic acid-binding protein
LVYAYDGSEPEKQVRAREVISAGDWVISTQVMQEFFVVVTRRLDQPLDAREALGARDDLALGDVGAIDAELVTAAAESSLRNQLSLWDALIVQAAARARCSDVMTEDLSHGQIIDGVAITNPFGLTPPRT